MSPNWIDGVWTGIGFQHQGFEVSTWTIKFTADEGKVIVTKVNDVLIVDDME